MGRKKTARESSFDPQSSTTGSGWIRQAILGGAAAGARRNRDHLTQSLSSADRKRILELFFSFPIPAVFVTKGQRLPAGLKELANAAGVPLIRTKLKTAEFYRRIKPVLEMEFAPTASLHGSLADVFGVGLFFTGASGIGKSECVLDLVERGHRLVADDLVITSKRGNDVLIGRGHELQRHYNGNTWRGADRYPGDLRDSRRSATEAYRGRGRARGVGSARNGRATGLDVQTTTILGVELPRIRVFLNPGKNITVIAEVIALNTCCAIRASTPRRRSTSGWSAA